MVCLNNTDFVFWLYRKMVKTVKFLGGLTKLKN